MKRSILAATLSGAVLGGIVAGASLGLPAGRESRSAGATRSSARIAPQPPLSPAGLPGPIIWDRDQIELAPADVRALWITPYTITDRVHNRVVFSPAQRGGE